MLKSLSLRERYKLHLEEKSKNKSKSDKELKWKVISEEIKQIKKRKRHLQSSLGELLKDADEMAQEAQVK